MKKTLSILVVVALVLSLGACSNNSKSEIESEISAQAPEKEQEVEKEVEETSQIKIDFDGSQYYDIGEGEFGIACPSGYTLSGDDAVIFLSKNDNTQLMQICIEAREMDGSLLSFIYIDGVLADKIQLANSQATLNLEGNSLAAGVHKVEAVQFVDNDPANDVITYKSELYTVEIH